MGNNPVRYIDPTGHAQACADGDEGGRCGSGANVDQIFTTFDKEHGGMYAGLFAEYYAKRHAATIARSRGDPNLDAYTASAESAYQYALAYVPQKDFDPSLLIDPYSAYQFANAAVSIGKDIIGATSWAIIIKIGSSGGLTAGLRFPEKIRQQAFLEDPTMTCVYCGREGVATEVDHVIPRSKGGNATIDNAQLACPHCNRSRGARDFPVTPPHDYEGPWPPPYWQRGR